MKLVHSSQQRLFRVLPTIEHADASYANLYGMDLPRALTSFADASGRRCLERWLLALYTQTAVRAAAATRAATPTTTSELSDAPQLDFSIEVHHPAVPRGVALYDVAHVGADCHELVASYIVNADFVVVLATLDKPPRALSTIEAAIFDAILREHVKKARCWTALALA